MSLKRPFDGSTPPRPRPPKKRYRLQSSDLGSSSPSTATSSSSLATPGPFSTPYTPPSDSPTNPFGRIRKLALNGSEPLALPRATSFAKHLPLRFQLVRVGGGGGGVIGEGTYRIVQVPLNYTFKHLHKLLLFLFDDNNSTHSELRPDLLLQQTGTRGHLFEVQDSIRMYPTKTPNTPSTSSNSSSRVGQIRSGHTWAKLSSVRDPFRRKRRKIRASGSDAVFVLGSEDEGCEGEEDWIWEAEEDFTVGHVWPEGGDLKRGCVYHHTPTTQIHITINTTRIPGRKGIGNKPFVFKAFGSGWSSARRALLGLGLGLGVRGSRMGMEEGEGGERGEERMEASRWNGHEAFEKFLKRDKKLENFQRAQVLQLDDEDCSSSSSSPSSPEPDPPTHAYSTQTPLPQTKLHRLRVQYASRRLERLTQKGLGELGEEVGFEEDGGGEDELDEEGEVC